MELESAEITKVSYNTFIGFKIIFANAIGEIVDKIGGDADEVTSALACATDRIISSKYLSVGMGDGGGCHPRDQIARSSFAQKNKISTDLFELIAKSRDAQTLALAKYIEKIYRLIDEHSSVDYFFVNSFHISTEFIKNFPAPFDTANLRAGELPSTTNAPPAAVAYQRR